jgi:hypothetical protein
MKRICTGIAVTLLLGPPAGCSAEGAAVATVKVASGTVTLTRAGQQSALRAGTKLEASDRITTGADGAVGVTFADNSLVSLGPGSEYLIETYEFDTTTHAGRFEAKLARGSLGMISGKLAKESPEAVHVKTPSTILGVRGTEFLVEVGGSGK